MAEQPENLFKSKVSSFSIKKDRYGETRFAYMTCKFSNERPPAYIFTFFDNEGIELKRISRYLDYDDEDFEADHIFLVDAQKDIHQIMWERIKPLGFSPYDFYFPLTPGIVFENGKRTICIEGWSEDEFVNYQIFENKQEALSRLLEAPDLQKYDKLSLQKNGLSFEKMDFDIHFRTKQYILRFYRNNQVHYILPMGTPNPLMIKLEESNESIQSIINHLEHRSIHFLQDKGGIFFVRENGELSIKGWTKEEFLANHLLLYCKQKLTSI